MQCAAVRTQRRLTSAHEGPGAHPGTAACVRRARRDAKPHDPGLSVVVVLPPVERFGAARPEQRADQHGDHHREAKRAPALRFAGYCARSVRLRSHAHLHSSKVVDAGLPLSAIRRQIGRPRQGSARRLPEATRAGAEGRVAEQPARAVEARAGREGHARGAAGLGDRGREEREPRRRPPHALRPRHRANVPPPPRGPRPLPPRQSANVALPRSARRPRSAAPRRRHAS